MFFVYLDSTTIPDQYVYQMHHTHTPLEKCAIFLDGEAQNVGRVLDNPVKESVFINNSQKRASLVLRIFLYLEAFKSNTPIPYDFDN